MQTKLLTVTTQGGTVRDEIIGWSTEDSNIYKTGKPIGMTGVPAMLKWPATVLEALNDGWRLLGPPQRVIPDPDDPENSHRYHDWWLVKESGERE